MSSKRAKRLKQRAKYKNMYRNNMKQASKVMFQFFRQSERQILFAKAKKNLGMELTEVEKELIKG